MVRQVMIHFIGEELDKMINYATAKPLKGESEKMIPDDFFRIVKNADGVLGTIAFTFFPDPDGDMHYHFSINTRSTNFMFVALTELYRRIGVRIQNFVTTDEGVCHVYWKAIELEDFNADDTGVRPINI